MVDLGGENLVIDYLIPHMVYNDKCPVSVANPMRFSTATTFLRPALQAPQMQNARMTPEQARHATQPESLCSASQRRSTCRNKPRLSRATTANMADVHRFASTAETTCGEGRRGGALACQQFVVQKVAEGFRPLTAQGRGAQIPWQSPLSLITPMDVAPDNFGQLAKLTHKSHGGARRSLPQNRTCIQTVVSERIPQLRGQSHQLQKTHRPSNKCEEDLCTGRTSSQVSCTWRSLLHQGQRARDQWNTTTIDYRRPAVAASICQRRAA